MKFIAQGLFTFLLVPFCIHTTVKAEPQKCGVSLTMPPILAVNYNARTRCESANGFWYNNECNLIELTNKQKTEQLAGQWCDNGTYYFLDINTVIEDIDNPGRYIISGGGIWAYNECSFKDDPYDYYSWYRSFNAVTGWYDDKQNKWIIKDNTEYPHCIKTYKLNDVTPSLLRGCEHRIGYLCGEKFSCLEVLRRIYSP